MRPDSNQLKRRSTIQPLNEFEIADQLADGD